MKIKLLAISAAAFTSIGCWSIGADSNAAALPKTQMKEADTPQSDFHKNLPIGFEMPADGAGQLLLREYGAVYVARGGVTPPMKVVFADEAEVAAYQERVERSITTLGGIRIELQAAAMSALRNAVADAGKAGLSITPRGADSARRGYRQTVTLWASRVNPGLVHWTRNGRLTKKEADRIRALSAFEQVSVILGLEQEGIFFSKDLSKSIIYSVAPPGTSQHLSMLALDVSQFNNSAVRVILAKHGWFQTVTSDLPHFTFLGVSESDLPGLGLKKVMHSGRAFWVPNI